MELSPAVIHRLSGAPWPGNVRQLRNEVMRLAACASGPVIGEQDLGEGLPSSATSQPAAAAHTAARSPASVQSLKSAIADLEMRMIQQALAETRDNQQQAARLLGLSRQGLINKTTSPQCIGPLFSIWEKF
jgi:DNA-binding NtrC family response regulator